jgi:regulatory protein
MHVRKTPTPLNEPALITLALRYVERYATTRAKLRAYLQRKLRERGWAGDSAPDPEAIAERFAERGYVNDAAYALTKSQSLTGRGYGKRRIAGALRAAGVEEADGEAAFAVADEQAVTAALRFAKRRRLGPFAQAKAPNPKARDKALSAMVRAGHPFDLSRAILDLSPGEPFGDEELSAR